jgi:hypothetical protein
LVPDWSVREGFAELSVRPGRVLDTPGLRGRPEP